MSKLVYICARNSEKHPFDARDIGQLSILLTPDNIQPRAPFVIEGDGILIGIHNATESLPVSGYSVCLGAFFGEVKDWWRPSGEIPDGTYALFRGDNTCIELVSDIVATRTIWYIKTDDIFIASTSQRAIVYFLQSFQPNPAVYPWMLSSGTLGPGLSWDRRIRCLGPDSRLILDRSLWKYKVIQGKVIFSPSKYSREGQEEQLRETITNVFDSLCVDLRKWILPLSGGYDSRAILMMLKHRPGLKTVTWGQRNALNDTSSDAWVAGTLARHYGIENEYLETDISLEPVVRIFKRFLLAGEGRVDHISGYMDGLAIWKHFYESGTQGILRGDEAFGCAAVQNINQVYKNMSFMVLSDFTGIDLVESEWLGRGDQRILKRSSLNHWRYGVTG